MTIGHYWALRDHETETKNKYDCVTHSLNSIEKDYHWAQRYGL